MGLKETVLRSIYGYGFITPSPPQRKGIVPILKGNDVIIQAQSGTGKTAAFVIPIAQHVNVQSRRVQAIVLSPTRDLAKQTFDVLQALGSRHVGLSARLLVGGTEVRNDALALQRGDVHVVVGTPGRVKQLMTTRPGHATPTLDASACGMFVLDEADEMLNQGFHDDVKHISRLLPGHTQFVLVSATMPKEILRMTEDFMRNPTRVLIPQEKVSLEALQQYYVCCERGDEDKLSTLRDLYASLAISQCVIFCNTKRKVDWLAHEMTHADDFTVSCIHAELTTEERNAVTTKFREGESRVLISTDVLARGFDVQHVSHVINFDLPSDKENYIHRIGRCARMGRKGIAINFTYGEHDTRILREIETHYHIKIEELSNQAVDEMSAVKP